MNETDVSNTGPPRHLAEIGQERQLALFRWVAISEQVQGELVQQNILDRVMAALHNRLVVETINQPDLDVQRGAMSVFKVHHADLSVAALAARLLPDVVLTDDLELRKGLESQGRTVVGSVGVMIRAFRTRQCAKAELQTHLDQLFDGSTLYLSKSFRNHIRKLLDSF